MTPRNKREPQRPVKEGGRFVVDVERRFRKDLRPGFERLGERDRVGEATLGRSNWVSAPEGLNASSELAQGD